MKKLVVINLGSTSTKIAYFEDAKIVFSASLPHPAEEIQAFASNWDQYDYRKSAILGFIALITLSLLNRDYLTAALNNKVTNSIFGYLGSISLYIYMLHYPVVIATLRILGHNTPETIYSFWTVYIPATVATVVLSALVNEIMKRTIMKKK